VELGRKAAGELGTQMSVVHARHGKSPQIFVHLRISSRAAARHFDLGHVGVVVGDAWPSSQGRRTGAGSRI
jgi:hypothetical protein